MMLEARYNKTALFLFDVYIGRLLRKNFSNFFLSNLPPELPQDKSLVITPNHISWWDGFFIHHLNRFLLNKNLYYMMLQKQLERYWFFRYLGAYSIIPENPKSISETVKYTSKILSNFKNAVAFYPQGEIEAFDKRPLNLKRGLQLFLRSKKDCCVVLPVAFKIQHYNKKYPAIIFQAGRIINPAEILNDFGAFEKEFYANLDALNESVFNQNFVKDLFERE
jgi:1-acyl-sn-glycerol-3-phosphate acyltransferase